MLFQIVKTEKLVINLFGQIVIMRTGNGRHIKGQGLMITRTYFLPTPLSLQSLQHLKIYTDVVNSHVSVGGHSLESVMISCTPTKT